MEPSVHLRAADSAAAARLRGIFLTILAYFFFALLDATAKHLVLSVAAMQIVWMRFVTHTAFSFAALKPWKAPRRFMPNRFWLQTLRAVFLFCATIFNFLALRYLQLAETASIFFLAPFMVTALAGPVLGEWAGIRRWIAIVVGFTGAIFILKPGPAGFQPALLLSLGATASYTGYVLMTRMLARSETSESMVFYPALFATIGLLPLGILSWQEVPDLFHWILLLLTGVFGGLGHWVFIKAHEDAPAPILAPFLYTQLLWMTGLGFLIFGDIPRWSTMIGALIIVASGLYLLYREYQVKGETTL